MQEPFITIAILSHNHEKYIEKAITSVLSQNTTFSYELLLFDDGSTDNTQNIINNYFLKFPEKIKTFCFKESKGPVFRAKQIYENSKGKYVAWLDADDYWTYHSKLQIQIDFLEQNPNYSGCFHDAIVRTENLNNSEHSEQTILQSLHKYRYYSQFNHYEDEFTPYLLIMRNIIPTASLVFRNSDFNDFLKNYNLQFYSFSWAFQLQIIKNGNFKYFNRCWSVYLDHSEGLSKKISSEKFTLNNISILTRLKKDNFYKRFKNTIHISIAKEYECIVYKSNTNYILIKYAIYCNWNYFLAFFWNVVFYKIQFLKQIFKRKK